MAADIKGTAVVWSVGTQTYAGLGTVSQLTQSLTFERTANKTDIKGVDGSVRTQVFSGFMKRLSINVIPSGTAISDAKTSADGLIPKPGTSVTVTDDFSAIVDPSTYNIYNVISARQNRSVEAPVSVDMELEASDESIQLGASVS